MKNQLAFEVFKGTPLEEVVAILELGEFSDGPTDEVAPNEEVIGELTSFEKALWSAAEKNEKEKRKIAVENNAMVNEAAKKGEEADDEVVANNKLAVSIKERDEKILHDLLWASIEQRLEQAAKKHCNLGIRKGYKIVGYKDCQECLKESLCSLVDLLSGA
jgi:hypothetical protein